MTSNCRPRIFLLLCLTALLGCARGSARDPTFESPAASESSYPPDRPSTTHALGTLIFYLPNRALDLVDPFRLRARVGPGTALGLRATTLADIYLGSYTSIYAGLPGPRNRWLPKLPVGLESSSGAGLSLANATLDGPIGPDYSATEFGLSIHILLIGLDAGIDPVEILDFFAGLILLDPRDDDDL